MTLLPVLQRCFGASPVKVHAAGPLEEEHEIALKAAEALLNANAQHNITDMYTLAAPVGHGAFAKVVECTHKVRVKQLTVTPGKQVLLPTLCVLQHEHVVLITVFLHALLLLICCMTRMRNCCMLPLQDPSRS